MYGNARKSARRPAGCLSLSEKPAQLLRSVVLAFVLTTAMAAPWTALADDSRQDQAIQDQRKYQEEVAVQDPVIRRKCIELAHKALLRSYRKAWDDKRMSEKLKTSVELAVDFEADNTGGFQKLKGLFSKSVMEEILNKVLDRSQANFKRHYEIFLDTLGDYYAQELGTLFAQYMGELQDVRNKAAQTLPGFEELQRLYLDDAAKKVHVEFGEVTHSGTPIVTWKNLKGITGSVAILTLRKALQKKVVQGLVKRLTGALGSKLIMTLEGPLGWVIAGVLAGHDVYSISQDIGNIPDRLKLDVYMGMKKEFLDEGPGTIWSDHEGLKQRVELQFDTLHRIVAGGLDSLYKEFRSCPAYETATKGLTPKEQGDLAMRLYLLRGTGTSTAAICDLSEKLGQVLVTVGPRQLNCIERGLKTLGLGVLASWVKLAPQRICDLIAIPPERLLALPPEPQNLARLTWVWELPESSQPVGLTLQIDARDYADWITGNLDRPRQASLLSGKTVEQVKKEVDGLRAKALAASGRQADGSRSWFETSASWVLTAFGGVPGDLGITQRITPILVAAGVVLFLLILVKLGLFRFIKWLLSSGPRK
ncbi:MAG: hypothetical protein AB1646_04570 [Thermodesulfobacteriota bacterium]